MVEETRKNYQEELNREIDEECERLGFRKPKEIQLGEKEIKKSETDSEAGIFLKGEHELQIAYLAQTVCDINGFISVSYTHLQPSKQIILKKLDK